MHDQTSVQSSLAEGIVNRIENILLESDDAGKPLEIEPYRCQLFELFVTADGAGYTEGESDLTADGLCRILAARWDLADATQESYTQQKKLPPEHLAKMRLLWSLMRMWMEWIYAWQRWNEFHNGKSQHSSE